MTICCKQENSIVKFTVNKKSKNSNQSTKGKEGGRKDPENKITQHGLKLVITILNYSAYKYQLLQWENVKHTKRKV